jgi:hypothetical protein
MIEKSRARMFSCPAHVLLYYAHFALYYSVLVKNIAAYNGIGRVGCQISSLAGAEMHKASDVVGTV